MTGVWTGVTQLATVLFWVQFQTPLSLATQFQLAGSSGFAAASMGSVILLAGFCTGDVAKCEQFQVPLFVALQSQFLGFFMVAIVAGGTVGFFAGMLVNTAAFCEQSQVPLFVALQSQSPAVFAFTISVVFSTAGLGVISWAKRTRGIVEGMPLIVVSGVFLGVVGFDSGLIVTVALGAFVGFF